ncbi:CST complex subunit CTC1 [Stegastes partitus]|uniref:CST complex subunit CTC1 n=1 Tax=Stegastes partitus TaxID=144197 RepID=A0A9Y4TUZ8_9TELE|nr:PREDICTED: CST complex subunit CTC1 [Stegastes partitus]
MDPQQRLLELLQPRSEAESTWLKNLFTFITEHLSPVACGPAPPAADGSASGVRCELSVYQLSVCVVQQIQEKMCVAHTLPVSYRLLSISELVSQQRVACVSNLSWSTNEQRAWAREAELSVPGQQALPRVNLLLIGCLREGRGSEWRLTDSSGSVRCECMSPSPVWLNRPVFLPHWNYIPQKALGQDEAGGCVELIGSPILLCAGPEQGLAACAGVGAGLNAVGVREAAGLLHHRVRGRRLAVWGQVGSVCPLLEVAGTTFFCFTLTDQSQSVPVLVKVGNLCHGCVCRDSRGVDSSKLCWSQCVCVGQSVCVTVLRVCVLRGWRGNNILCVTDCSELHTDYTPRHTQDLTQAPAEHTPTNMDMPLMMMSHASDDSEEAEPDVQSGVRMKQSRVISYQGIVTKVVSEGAGLYVIDGRVGLCLAYQPMPKRKLRAGDRVELHHVHFLFKPCPDFPPSMLCCCLRSSLKVTAFSRVGGGCPAPRCPGDGTLPRLLLQGHRGVSEYLWVCHLSSQLTHSLVPGVLKQQCVCLLSWRMMETLLGQGRQRRRDIYSEMLDEPHTCPVTQVVLHTWRLGCPLCYCSVFTVSLQVYLQFSLDHVHILSSSVAMTTSSVGSSPRPCVSVVIRVEQKEGVAWMNTGAGTTEKAGLTLCFSARAAVIGPVVRWGQDPKNGPMTSREAEREGEDKSARWFPVLHRGCFYRLIAASTQDPSALIGSGVSGRSGVELHTDSTLQVRSDWRFHTLTCPLLLHTCRQVLSSTVLSVSEVLDSRSELVCFQGMVSERISVSDRTAHSGHTGVSLTLCDQSGRSLKVYLDLSHTPYPPGLLPGNTLLLSAFQRRQSRIGSVYCTFLPVSSITVISLGDTSLAPPPPPAPIMHLGPWALSSEQRCIVGQVKGHVVCFLFLQLQWSCSLCGSVYTQSCCSSQCRSTSSIFQSNAKLVIDDGTGEAHVWFSGALVRSLLGLADSQWEGLQRALRVKGHIRVYPRGRSLVCDGDSDESLFNFLTCVCGSDVVCRPISFTCRNHTNLRTQEVRRFNRADRDFSTTLLRPLQLTCLHLH